MISLHLFIKNEILFLENYQKICKNSFNVARLTQMDRLTKSSVKWKTNNYYFSIVYMYSFEIDQFEWVIYLYICLWWYFDQSESYLAAIYLHTHEQKTKTNDQSSSLWSSGIGNEKKNFNL